MKGAFAVGLVAGAIAGGTLGGILLATIAGRGGECRVLDEAVPLVGPEHPHAGQGYLPVGTRFAVVASDEVHETRVPIRLPDGVRTRPCAGEPVGLVGFTW